MYMSTHDDNGHLRRVCEEKPSPEERTRRQPCTIKLCASGIGVITGTSKSGNLINTIDRPTAQLNIVS